MAVSLVVQLQQQQAEPHFPLQIPNNQMQLETLELQLTRSPQHTDYGYATKVPFIFHGPTLRP